MTFPSRRPERSVIDEAANPEILKYEDSSSIEVLRAVLQVAIEDQSIQTQELNLIRRLREKLGVREKTKHIVLAQLNHFPRSKNRVHSPSEIKAVLTDLQKRGVVFYCNHLDGGRYVLPEEILPPVKDVLDIQMSRKGWEKLLDHLSGKQLARILEEAELPRSGSNEARRERIRLADLPPRDALEALPNQDLYDALHSLPGAKVSGSKADRLDRLIEYFDKMLFRDVPEEAPVGELYFQYLAELAGREREILLANEVIRKDQEMDRAFEEGTRHLFHEKLGLESSQRVGCFLIITADVGAEAAERASRLKIESESDTDVAVITAENLLWLANHWLEEANGRPFNPEVFNTTGILDRGTLEGRVGLFL